MRLAPQEQRQTRLLPCSGNRESCRFHHKNRAVGSGLVQFSTALLGTKQYNTVGVNPYESNTISNSCYLLFAILLGFYVVGRLAG